MNSINMMEKLLNDVEVEWVTLGNIAEIYGGLTGKSKGDFGNGNAKYISYKNIFDNIAVNFNILESVNVADSENQREVKYGDILFTGSSETADEVGMSASIVTKLENTIYLNSFSFGVRFNKGIPLTPEFSKYLFRTSFMRDEISKTASGVTRFNVSKARFKKIQIPIPCLQNPKKSLEIQAEIVRILDTFTELITELITELTTRKKQYNYYRDKLLSFEEGEVEWRTLNDICLSISAGGDVPENYAKGQTRPSAEFPYPIYANATGANGLYGFTDNYKIESDAVTISARGAKIGFHTARDGKFTPIIRLITLVPNKRIVSTRFLNYILDMTPIGGTDGGIPQLTVPTVQKISIPVPAVAEQERIVAILDKFDALTNSITEGLPREIELRQKQYEYYRDLLLSFPKPEEASS
jgi:type I restriction enzyme, S subunit